MPFDNDIEQMMNYLERFCKAPHIDALDNVSDEQVNLLLDFLTLAHKLSCDIYATSNLSCSHFLGIGVFSTSQDRAPQGNLFVKVEADNLYLSFELEECGEDSLLTPIRVIDALIYLAERTGHAHLPEDYIKQ